MKKISELTLKDIAGICDHTFLKTADAFNAKPGGDPEILCDEAFKKFLKETLDINPLPYAICIRPENVAKAATYFREKSITVIKIASVVGFPDGTAYDTAFKIAETITAINDGATEIDMVLNYKRFKEGDNNYVYNDIVGVVNAAHERNVLVKLILETSELDASHIQRICEIAETTGVDFVKTSTGYSASGAKAQDLKIMRQYFSRGIKMSGGVNKDNYKELLSAASGRDDGYIDLDPCIIRIGESSLLKNTGSGY